MNHLSVESVSKSFNENQLFSDLSFGLEQGQKTGLVGVNGCGKSTLLKMIAGFESPDTGKVVVNKQVKVGYLDQKPPLNDDDTVLEAIFNADEKSTLSLIKQYEYVIDQIESGQEPAQDISELIDKIDSANAWDYESQVKQILSKLGIHNFDQQVGTLSGGQKKRIALAAVLVDKPDFLILDEPTNHLDIEMIEWLENHLSNQQITLLLVTHDRYFLDKVTNNIIELYKGGLRRYNGNYADFLEKRLELGLQEKADVDKAKNLMRKELDWMRRQPKARGTKAKYRIDAFHDLKDKAHKEVGEDVVQLEVHAARQGKKILEMDHISHSFGNLHLLKNFSYIFKKGDRIGIIGKNGVGKTTFLDILTQQLSPDQGEVVIGPTTQIGYYSQENYPFDPQMRVIDTVKEVAEVVQLTDKRQLTASQLLNMFLFPPETQYGVVGKLSGGERRRLQLLRVLIKNPNFLILDEPTNDLDLQTLNVLEDFLTGFPGCLMLVSHDRYFMDKLVDHSFIFHGGGKIEDFAGNYSDFRIKSAEKEHEKVKSIKKSTEKQVSKVEKPKHKLSYKEQLEYEKLEVEIDQLEEQKKTLIKAMNGGEMDHDTLVNAGIEINKIDQDIDDKTNRWLFLSQFL